MAKFKYVGDPAINPETKKPLGVCASGRVTFTNGPESVTFEAGVATEAPAWLAPRLEKNNHFEPVVERKPVEVAAKPDAPKGEPKK